MSSSMCDLDLDAALKRFHSTHSSNKQRSKAVKSVATCPEMSNYNKVDHAAQQRTSTSKKVSMVARRGSYQAPANNGMEDPVSTDTVRLASDFMDAFNDNFFSCSVSDLGTDDFDEAAFRKGSYFKVDETKKDSPFSSSPVSNDINDCSFHSKKMSKDLDRNKAGKNDKCTPTKHSTGAGAKTTDDKRKSCNTKTKSEDGKGKLSKLLMDQVDKSKRRPSIRESSSTGCDSHTSKTSCTTMSSASCSLSHPDSTQQTVATQESSVEAAVNHAKERRRQNVTKRRFPHLVSTSTAVQCQPSHSTLATEEEHISQYDGDTSHEQRINKTHQLANARRSTRSGRCKPGRSQPSSDDLTS